MSISESLFAHGTERLTAQEYEKSILWLTSCFTLVWKREEELFSEIRVKSIQNLGRALLSQNQSGDLAKVADLIAIANEDYSVTSWLFLLKFDHALLQYAPQTNASEELLESMIRILQLSASDLAEVLSRVYSLSKCDYQAAARVLDSLLIKVAASDQATWTEKVLVCRVWTASQALHEPDEILTEQLMKSFKVLEVKLSYKLGLGAIHAVQVVRPLIRAIIVLKSLS